MGSVSRTPKIFGSSYQPPKPPRQLISLGQTWKAITIVVVLAVSVLLISRLPIFKLKTVELIGDKDDTIARNLASLQGQSIFSHSISALIDQSRVQLNVADFSCRRGLPNALRCTLKVRTPVIIWRSGDQQYLVDKTGFLFAVKSTDWPGLLAIDDLQKLPVKIGSVVASSEIINQYQQLVVLLAAKQLSVSQLHLNESLYQVTALIDRPGKSPIQGLFLLSEDARSQVEAVSAVLAQKGDAITESVDARVPGYVYTK